MKMKNIVILMMAIITFAQGLYAEQSYSAETRREVAIKVVVIGSDIPRPRPRSLRPIITAALEENQLWIDFYEPLGDVTIVVKNSYGQIVCEYTCDTEYEPTVVLYVPTEMGYYSLDIVGDQIEAYGEYTYE